MAVILEISQLKQLQDRKDRSNMGWASWYFYSLIHQVSICSNILGQSTFGEKELLIDNPCHTDSGADG